MLHNSESFLMFYRCFLRLDLCIKSLHLRRQLDSRCVKSHVFLCWFDLIKHDIIGKWVWTLYYFFYRLWSSLQIQKLLLLLKMLLMEEVSPGDYCRHAPYKIRALWCYVHTDICFLWTCRYLIPELGACSLKITYSAHTDLSVKFQSHRSR